MTGKKGRPPKSVRPIPKIFSERLIFLLEKNNLTAYTAAKKLDVSQAELSLLKRGKRAPSVYTLCVLAKYFCVSTDFLLGLD